MSRLLARIMLALLMLPLGAVVYILCIVIIMESMRSRAENIAFMVGDVATATFVGVYWWALWRRDVNWTARRVQMTIIGSAVAVFIGGVVGVIGSSMEPSFGIFIGGTTAILLWLVATVFAWRESDSERTERVALSGVTIVCPQCGYDMTGLERAQCPECGAQYSIDDLVARQRSRDQDELDEAVEVGASAEVTDA